MRYTCCSDPLKSLLGSKCPLLTSGWWGETKGAGWCWQHSQRRKGRVLRLTELPLKGQHPHGPKGDTMHQKITTESASRLERFLLCADTVFPNFSSYSYWLSEAGKIQVNPKSQKSYLLAVWCFQKKIMTRTIFIQSCVLQMMIATCFKNACEKTKHLCKWSHLCTHLPSLTLTPISNLKHVEMRRGGWEYNYSEW